VSRGFLGANQVLGYGRKKTGRYSGQEDQEKTIQRRLAERAEGRNATRGEAEGRQ